jgi:hypothetical protein
MSGGKVSQKHIVFTSVGAGGDDRVDLEALRVSKELAPMYIYLVCSTV